MGDPYPYGLLDFQQLIAGRSSHHDLPEPPCLGGATAGAAAVPAAPIPNNYNVVFSHGFATTFAPSNHHRDCSSSVVNNISPTSTNPTVTASALANHGTTTAFCSSSSSSMEVAEKGWLGFDAANNRWPRQETLLLLEIRSRLDSKFRETNHKAPLWNEISRIMSEEYGYQRSGKKCKEKFENLYKYYKKTKEGKAGRQDGKHYRFFRQLEAICGESTRNITTSANYQPPLMTFTDGDEHINNNNNNIKYCSKSLSLSNNSSDQFETSSCENNDDKDLSAIAYGMKQKHVEIDRQIRHSGVRERKSLRGEVEEIVDSNMRKIIESQDAWMEKMMSVVEHREQEMMYKEEERKKDSIKFDQEVYQLWAKERAWVATRDTALMEVVKKHLGKEITTDHHQPMVEEYEEEPQAKNKNNGERGQNWRFQI
ncbi:trihelix transcription factor PTL-like [Neltuma alba]|uniref:trihelix transcription factor PTL-like n=1 Tax=Neltuma alba TaxID=207710 RepID=UPI0010A4A68B|nr:trihelix transcription factor PTL-like [Prosopis alba]